MAEKQSRAKKFAAGALMGLLALSLLGFGVEGFGTARQTVGTVGTRDITADDYARALQSELRALGNQLGQDITMEQARNFGIDRRVLDQLVNRAVLDTEAERLGVSAGDATVQSEIVAISSFQGLDGSFDREAYRFALENAGLSEAAFERSIRDEVARSILQMAAIGGATAPAPMVDAVLDHQAQTRDVTVLSLGPDDLDSAVGAPNDTQLRDHYDANIDRYTRPAGKRIAYAWVTPDMLVDTLQVDEQALRDAYAARADQYRQPERRLVERLVFPDMAAARDARARLDAGDATFEDLVAERGLSLDDTDMGDVTRDDLDAAAEPVFALDQPGIAGPVRTSLGPALFRMNAILAARETSFEDARAELRDQLLRDRARRVLDDNLDLYEDLLAGGATVQELAAETDMQAGTIDWRPGLRDGIAAYDSFRAAARALEDGDFPTLETLSDGGLFAVELVEPLPEAPQPLAEIRTQVTRDWQQAEIRDRLATQARALADRVAGGTAIDALGHDTLRFADLTRDTPLPDLPGAVRARAFELSAGDTAIVTQGTQAHLVRLHAVADPEPDQPATQELRARITERMTQSYTQDLQGYFTDALRQSMQIELDQAMIDAVQQNF